MKPGVYRGLSNDEYHSGRGVSKSLLDLLDQSPAHLRAAVTSTEPRKATAAQSFGTAFHMILLEPERFAASYCEPFESPAGALVTVEDIKQALTESGVPFKASARKSDLAATVREHLPAAVLYDDAKEAYLAQNAGRIELTPDQWKRLNNMREAVFAHKAASKLLSASGESELSAYWEEPVADVTAGKPRKVLCRVRPDYWRHDGILVDLKSAHEDGADGDTFARAIDNYRYHVQNAMYVDGAAKALAASKGKDFEKFSKPRAFVFLAVEKDACVVDGIAKGVAVYQLGDQSVSLGRELMRQDLWRYATCDLAGQWPGYPETIQAIELPPYAFTRHAARAA